MFLENINFTEEITLLTLEKGVRINLDKAIPGLVAAYLGLGWDVNKEDDPTTKEDDFDLDASVFMLNKEGKLINEKHVVYYGNLISPYGKEVVEHMGDNLTGEGAGDDETILFDLRKVPEIIETMVLTVTIFKAGQRHQNFGMVENAYFRIVDVATKQEALRFDLDEEFSLETSVVLAELYRTANGWDIKAIAEGVQGDLNTLVNRYS